MSPYSPVGVGWPPERSWRCRNLLQAMYWMLWWDTTGGNTIRYCERSGCPNTSAWGRRAVEYYSERCANLASTRMSRGQEP